MHAQSCSPNGQCSTSCSQQGKCSGGSCAPSSCKESSCCSEGGMLCALMSTASCAKKELMKEKIKAHLEAKAGKKFDKIAEMVADMYIEKMRMCTETSEKKSDAEEELIKIMKS